MSAPNSHTIIFHLPHICIQLHYSTVAMPSTMITNNPFRLKLKTSSEYTYILYIHCTNCAVAVGDTPWQKMSVEMFNMHAVLHTSLYRLKWLDQVQCFESVCVCVWMPVCVIHRRLSNFTLQENHVLGMCVMLTILQFPCLLLQHYHGWRVTALKRISSHKISKFPARVNSLR